MKNATAILNAVLLFGILVVLVLILRRMPPTVGDRSAAKDTAAKRALRFRQPIVTVHDPIDVHVESGSIDVEPGSTPLPVTIER